MEDFVLQTSLRNKFRRLAYASFEVLDRDVRKPHENPALGVLLCTSKDDEVVEYVLNRGISDSTARQETATGQVV